MRRDSLYRDGRTAMLYREKRVQHRYHKRIQKPQFEFKDFEWRDCSPFDLPNQMKTMEYQEFDQLMFSDSRIKNYNHQSTDTYHKNRLPKNFIQRCSKMTSHEPSQAVTPKNPQQRPNSVFYGQKYKQKQQLEPNVDQKNSNYFRLTELNKKKTIQNDQNNKRRTTSATNKRRYTKQSFSMDETKNKNSTLSPTIMSMKLSSPNHIDKFVLPNTDKQGTSKKLTKKERITIYSKEKKIEPQKKDHRQKIKFAINGWQFQNPSFHQLQDLYHHHSPQKQQLRPREVKTAGERRLLYQRGKIS